MPFSRRTEFMFAERLISSSQIACKGTIIMRQIMAQDRTFYKFTSSLLKIRSGSQHLIYFFLEFSFGNKAGNKYVFVLTYSVCTVGCLCLFLSLTCLCMVSEVLWLAYSNRYPFTLISSGGTHQCQISQNDCRLFLFDRGILRFPCYNETDRS